MNIIDMIVIVIACSILAYAFYSAFRKFKDKDRGGCSGCMGGCPTTSKHCTSLKRSN